MMLIREFDSRLAGLYTRGLIRGSSHPAIGQEAVAVGACAALRDDDYITSTHRGHGHAIAKGADPRRMMAELLGRSDGYCRGKGGSMHIADFSVGMLGANGIVGGGIGLAGGAALSSRLRGEDRVAVCFFGDGALNKGVFHEVSNMAGVWKLPLVLLCENNQYAMSARVDRMTCVADLERRADALRLPEHDRRRHGSRRGARRRGRGGRARPRGRRGVLRGRHVLPLRGPLQRRHDALPRRRGGAELARARPAGHVPARLIAEGVLDEPAADALEQMTRNEIDAAVEFAIDSPLPDAAEAWEHVLA